MEGALSFVCVLLSRTEAAGLNGTIKVQGEAIARVGCMLQHDC